MIQIILTSDQEQFLQEQLNSGKYKTPQEIVTEAFKLLAERNKLKQKIEIIQGEEAQKYLEEQVKKFRQESKENRNNSINLQRLALAEEFSRLCQETQALHIEHPITEEEIAAEIEAYRRGEGGSL